MYSLIRFEYLMVNEPGEQIATSQVDSHEMPHNYCLVPN